MNKFFKNLLYFTIPLFSYFAINISINHYIYSEEKVDLGNPRILISGDSHMQKSLNPDSFKSAINISQTAEPYILTYWKLQKIFKSFYPDTLILGFAPHNISQFNDLKFSDENWASEMFRRSYPIEKFEETSLKISVDYKTFFKIYFKETALYPKSSHINYLGSYSNSNNASYKSNWEEGIRRHFYHEGKKLNYSDITIHYLNSIIALLEKKDIKLILASSPVHEDYLSSVPPDILNKYNQLLKIYSKNHTIFDKTANNYSESLFLDSDHLNQNGAKRFTLEFIDFLEKT